MTTVSIHGTDKWWGASTWLTTIPVAWVWLYPPQASVQRYHLSQLWLETVESTITLSLWKAFSVSHVFNCSMGAFPSIRHTWIKDMLVQFLTEVCPNVSTKPGFQLITRETFSHRSANADDGSRSSMFFDVRAFNSHVPSSWETSSTACYCRHEFEKRRTYEKRITEVEHGYFTPIVLSSGGWGLSATVAFKRLAPSLCSLLISQLPMYIAVLLCYYYNNYYFQEVKTAYVLWGLPVSRWHGSICPTSTSCFIAIEIANS